MKYMKVFGMMMCYMMIDTQLKLSRQLIIYLQKKAYKKDHNFHIINFKYMYMIWICRSSIWLQNGNQYQKTIVNITTISVQVKKTNMEEQCHVNSCCTHVLWGSTVYIH